MSDDEYEEEQFLVFADFKNQLLPSELTAPNASIKIIGLESNTPMAEVNGNVFKGSYDHAMGTLVFFEKDNKELQTDPIFDFPCKQLYKIIGNTNKVLNFQRVFVEKDTDAMDVDDKEKDDKPSDRNLRFSEEYKEAMERMLCQKMAAPIQIRKFLEDYRDALKPIMPISTKSIDLQTALHLQNDAEQYKLLKESCALEQLEQKDDEIITPYMPGVSEHTRKKYFTNNIPECELNFVKKIIEFKDTNSGNPFKRTTDSFRLLSVPDNPIKGEPIEAYNDVIVTVRFYRPPRVVHSGNRIEPPVFAEEFECLGSNFLTDLRDKISCICNKKRFFDLSETPNAENALKITDPAFFFISRTFYNDKRHPENADYSETIRNWAKTAPGLENIHFEVESMEKTQFLDLNISIGFPNLYMHHGNCEHVFVFSQIEVFTHGAACQYRKQYPRLRSMNIFNIRLCHMCNRRHFNYIVQDSNRQLHNPTYLCVNCFFGYHYIDCKKVGEFKAYRINDFTEYDDEQYAKESSANEDELSSCVSEDSEILKNNDL